MTTTPPDLATEAAKAGNYPNEFNKREARLLASVKDYVDNSPPNDVITTEGDIIVGDSSGDADRLAIGTTGYTLVSDGTTLAWGQLAAAGLASNAVTTAKITDANVTTAKIADANVTLAKLASGVAPSHVVKYAGKFTTAGGDATETISQSGVASTDIVFVNVQTAGVTPRSVVAAIPSTNTITITMSGDPSTDHILSWQVLRATS